MMPHTNNKVYTILDYFDDVRQAFVYVYYVDVQVFTIVNKCGHQIIYSLELMSHHQCARANKKGFAGGACAAAVWGFDSLLAF